MGRLLIMSFAALSVGLTGCQQTKMTSQPPKAQANVAATPSAPPTPPARIYPPYNGQIPVIPNPPPVVVSPTPPVYNNPPPTVYNNPPPAYNNPPAAYNNPPPAPPAVSPTGPSGSIPSGPTYPQPTTPTTVNTPVSVPPTPVASGPTSYPDYPENINVGPNQTPQTPVVPNLTPPPSVHEWTDVPAVPVPTQPTTCTGPCGSQQVVPEPLPPAENYQTNSAPAPLPLAQQPPTSPLPPPAPVAPLAQPMSAAATNSPVGSGGPIRRNAIPVASAATAAPAASASAVASGPQFSGPIPQPPRRPVEFGGTPDPTIPQPPKPIVQDCVSPVPVITPRPQAPELDILFVVDASASVRAGPNNGKLGQIANQMKNFVHSLDKNVNYHIGVIIGHGDPKVSGKGYEDNWHGRLFTTPGTQMVLKSEEMLAQCKGNTTCAEQKVASILYHRIASIPKDKTGADGELLELSLYDALANEHNKGQLISAGLLRDQATLSMVMITDEQDGCFDYTGTPFKPVQVHFFNKQTHKMDFGTDPSEANTLEQFCAHAVDGRRFSSNDLADTLRKLKGDRLAIIGISYLDDATIPKSGNNGHETAGHGLIQLTQALGNDGKMVDMAGGIRGQTMDYSREMAAMGAFANLKINTKTELLCDTKVHAQAVNQSSLEVHLFDKTTGKEIPGAIFSGSCLNSKCPAGVAGPASFAIPMNGDQTNPKAVIRISPEAVAHALKGVDSQNVEARIRFVTRTDRDVHTGVALKSSKHKKVRPKNKKKES